MEVPRLSKSRVLQYCRCPMQYKLVNINRVPFSSPAMSDGSWFHRIAERFFDYLEYDDINPKNFEPILRKLAGERYDTYSLWFTNFIKFETERYHRLPKSHYRPKYREVKIVIREPKYAISTIIDRVDYEPKRGNYLTIDYKTGKTTNIKKHLFEMVVYAYVFREHFKKPIPNVGIFSAADGKFTEATITEEHITEMKNVLKQVKAGIEDDYFPIRPKNCWWCPNNVKDVCHNVCKEDWLKHNRELVK